MPSPADESADPEPHETDPSPPRHDQPEEPPYLRTARYAWATIGLAGAFVLVGFVVGKLSLVVIPVILALFPAAVLMPIAQWLKRLGLPAAAASILTILALLVTLASILALLGLSAADDIPALQDSLSEGITDLEETIQEDPLGLGYDFPGFGELFEQASESLTQGGGGEEGAGNGTGLASGAAGAASTVGEGVAGLLLVFVTMFFFLKDEGRLSQGVIATFPSRWQRHATALASRFWRTLGAYFRSQLLVALVDAVFIGLGLILLGIPLAIPLAVIVLFGALFPIIGALVSGGAAVLVALADAGPTRALMVLLLIVVVQQVEGSVLQPVIMSNAIKLHPLVVILVLTAGSVVLGILGAFVAVPVAAGLARALDYAREEMGEQAPPDLPEIPAHT